MVTAGDLASYDGAEHPAHGQLTEPSNYMEIERDLTLLGFAGLEDPPRGEVPLAVRDCQLAGIRVRLYLSCAHWIEGAGMWCMAIQKPQQRQVKV